MSQSSDRFYLLSFRNRPVYWGDVGSELTIQGLVVGGNGAQATLFLPGFGLQPDTQSYVLSDEDWSDFIRRSDDPEVLVGNAKVFQRKLRFQVSGAIQQKVWASDNFQCQYCGVRMGKQLLTVDHFLPIELGGENNEGNYLTVCRPCNKDKGSQHPDAWCPGRGIDPDRIREYLKSRKI